MQSSARKLSNEFLHKNFIILLFEAQLRQIQSTALRCAATVFLAFRVEKELKLFLSSWTFKCLIYKSIARVHHREIFLAAKNKLNWGERVNQTLLSKIIPLSWKTFLLICNSKFMLQNCYSFCSWNSKPHCNGIWTKYAGLMTNPQLEWTSQNSILSFLNFTRLFFIHLCPLFNRYKLVTLNSPITT